MRRSHPPVNTPLRLGNPEDFARMESLLKTASFDEPTICRALKIEDMSDIGSVKPEETDLITAGSGLLALLIRIFLFLQSPRREEVERLIDPAALRSLLALDVLRLARFNFQGTADEVYYSPVLLYPVAGLLIASDRHNNPDGSPFVPPPDIVFPAIYFGTLRFLRVISKSPVINALDLC
jgi:hypothetical protein